MIAADVVTAMEAHEFLAVTAQGQRCTCGHLSRRIQEHFAAVALSVLDPTATLVHVDSDMQRTRGVLRELAARQEALGRELDALGIVDFVERSEWLHAQRTPDEVLAWERHWRDVYARWGSAAREQNHPATEQPRTLHRSATQFDYPTTRSA